MKKTLSLLVLTISSLLTTGCIIVSAKSPEYKTTENLSLSTNKLTELKVDAGAGFILIEGNSALDKIEVVADIISYDKNYKLTLTEKNGLAILIADPNPEGNSNWFVINSSNSKSAKIDLTIKLPKGLNLSIDDGSGNIDVHNISGKVSIEDGSGNINLKNIDGEVNIEDGSGNIDLTDITQTIEIDDGSGDIIIHNAGSKVAIEDGSGEIQLFDIIGEIDLDDGSGDLLVKGAKGHVTINDGSGDIKVVALDNGLTVLNAGSGGLSMSNVKGDIVTH